ncbi:MAG: hypothetical protein NVSMB9_22040 [Isosphaeraceae bacterium]
MNPYRPASLPELPLLLWDTPPGLQLVLAQEGIAHRQVVEPHPLAFQGGKFVLFDSRCVSEATVRARLSSDHVAIDVDRFRGHGTIDPFTALIDSRAAYARWEVDGHELTERVSRHDKGVIRDQLIRRLRQVVTSEGGLWARLSPYPFPFRSAFNLRVDLDETGVEDYARFARARRRLEDCTTHFVSTKAYGDVPVVLQDLLRFDTQSHAHHHVIYRDPQANRRNLTRADKLLRESGFEPTGFAAPHGRWNSGLDRVIEDLGYIYSSDFQLGHDDFPFFPWRDENFSNVLQVPVHPICEGLFFEAGARTGRAVADHLIKVVRAKIKAGEPAFVYGHPERRLGRHPEILSAISEAIACEPLLWRVTLTEFALWWRWRNRRLWSVIARGDKCFEVQFDDWDPRHPLGLEIIRGRHVSTVSLTGPRTVIQLNHLAYEQREPRADLPRKRIISRPRSLKSAVRTAIDWETETPLEELSTNTLAACVKKSLRWWRSSQGVEGNQEARREAIQ